jgi:hypothetical protein
LGCNVKQGLLDIATVYDDSEIWNSIKSNPAIIELGQHAKLKGLVQDALSPLHILVGTVLKKLFSPPRCYSQ